MINVCVAFNHVVLTIHFCLLHLLRAIVHRPKLPYSHKKLNCKDQVVLYIIYDTVTPHKSFVVYYNVTSHLHTLTLMTQTECTAKQVTLNFKFKYPFYFSNKC